MADCPHCKADLGSGFVTQEVLVDRLKGPATERDKARAERDAALAEAASAKDVAKAATEKARADIEAAVARATAEAKRAEQAIAARDRFQALAQNSIVQPAKVKGISSAYDTYAAEAADKALPFAEWLAGPAREDEFLAPHFAVAKPAEATATAAAEPAKPVAAVAPPAKALPASNVGVGQPPLETGRLTADQVGERYSAEADKIRQKYPKREDRSKRDVELAELKESLTKTAAPAV